MSYRFDDGFIKLIEKYSDGNKTGFVEKSIACYIKKLKNGTDIIQESVTPRQRSDTENAIQTIQTEDAIQTEIQTEDVIQQQLNIRIDELKLSMEKIEKKHEEETVYWRDKIDNWEQRYDLQVLESNKKFERLMTSIDESRSHNYLQNGNADVRIEGIIPDKINDIAKVIEPPKEKQEKETKGFWCRVFGQ